MDITRPTASRITAVALVAAACIVFAGPTVRPRAEEARVVITGASAAQEQMVDWAIRRYRDAGLDGLPTLEYRFYPTRDGCGGDLGRYRAGLVRLCTSESSERYAKKYLLHEMAHAWTEANIDPGMQERFLRLRGLSIWNGVSVEWKERGIEQGAEIIAWGLGEGGVPPMLPLPIDPQGLLEAYALLTGQTPISPTVAGA
jgi:hypothetical protein